MRQPDDRPVPVVARWRAAPGQAETVRAILRELAAASQREPGCLGFTVLESAGQPGSFVLVEWYEGRQAQADHLASGHFRALVLERAVPLLASRDVQEYRVLVPDTAVGGEGARRAPRPNRKGARQHDQP
jgi:quinol monooxygenase YgiN